MPRFSLRVLALIAAALVLPAAASAQVTTRNMQLMSHWHEYSSYSACWSYIHEDGREYALLGTFTGLAIYNVTDPANSYRVGFISGVASQWREIKSYRNWIYVSTEGDGGAGFQIIRMTDPENPVLAATVTAQFTKAHTVAVDTTRGLLIFNGTRTLDGLARGMHIYSLSPNPEAPTWLARWPAGAGVVSQTEYIHDCVPIGNRLYGSSIYAGIQRVFDFTNPALPVQVASWTYPGAFTHNAWPDATGNYLYVTDETNGEPLKIFDISNLATPTLVNGTITSNSHAIVHNAHVLGNELYLSNYTEGIRILDMADPAHPAEFAYADSWPGVSGGFNGVWEVCPYFPSGTVIASDIQTGLYVYRPSRNYGLLRIQVEAAPGPVLACSNEPGGCCCAPNPCDCGHGPNAAAAAISGVTVRLGSGDSLKTGSDGVAQFAPDAGSVTFTVSKFGYDTYTDTRTVTQGGSETVVVTLQAKPLGDFSGSVLAAGSLAPLEDAQVDLLYTPLHKHTDTAGAYAFLGLPNDTYRIDVRRPGRIALSGLFDTGPGNTTQDFQLAPTATWDALEAASGWVAGATGDNATSGAWVRVEPFGTGTPQNAPVSAPLRNGIVRGPTTPFHEGHEEDAAVPGDVQPELDRSPPPGTMCFVTGQGNSSSNIGQADVDNGRTSLTSPALDLASMADPAITWWHWFYADDNGAEDALVTQISNNNGASWVPVDTTRGMHNHWMERTVRVADYVAPSTQVKLRFVAWDIGVQGIVEAAIDDFSTWDRATVIAVTPPASPARLAFQAPRPNPARGDVRLAVEVPADGDLAVDVLDVQGRLVRSLHHGAAAAGTLALSWDGVDARGRAAGAGLFFVRARGAGAEATTRLVKVR